MAPARPAPEPRPAPDAAPSLTLDALRALGAQRIDPVRFAYVAALARRAEAHQGEARQLLDARLASALAALAARCAPALAGTLATGPAPASPGRPGPLAALVTLLDRPVLAGAPASGQPVELQTMLQFRSTWARLSIDRQLSRSQAQLPQNPGPLNSQLLALRALQLMQELSPAYLQHFVAQVEALLWLEAASSAPTAAPAAARSQRRSSAVPRKPALRRGGA